MRPRDLFVHPSERRLRAPLRLLVHGAACAALGVGVALLARSIAAGAFELWWAAQLAAIALLTLALGAGIDRRRRWARALGADTRGALELAAGAGLGCVLVLGIAGAEIGLGVASLVVSPAPVDVAAAGVALALFAAIAVAEELVFRAYHLTNLAEGLRARSEHGARATVLALALSSLGFGLAHAGNPNATVIGVANVTLAGVLLGLPFVLTGRLGLGIGLHFAWNLTQSLLDMPVSGQRVGVALVVRAERGPTWLTGGAFGPEGGVLGLAAIVIGAAAIVAWARATTGAVRVAPGLGEPPGAATPSRAERVVADAPPASPPHGPRS